MISLDKKEILSLLAEEQTQLAGVEQLTEKILCAPSDDFIDLIADRGTFLNRAVLAENRLKTISAADEALRGVLSGRADLNSLTPDMQEIFEASLRVKAILCRIRRLEPQVVTRMENERAEALSHIEELNRSSGSIAGTYKAAVSTAVTNRVFTGSGLTV